MEGKGQSAGRNTKARRYVVGGTWQVAGTGGERGRGRRDGVGGGGG